MNDRIAESDWKLLRELQPLALDRFCRRVLGEVGRLAADANCIAHDRYLAVYNLVQRSDNDLVGVFNDLRRSNAILRLAAMRTNRLVSDEEFGRFTWATRTMVDALVTAES